MKQFLTTDELRRDVEQTGYLHRPLPLHPERSLERLGLGKRVVREKVLCGMETSEGWEAEGPGTLTHTGRPTPSGHTSLRMEVATTGEKWPEDNPTGDYTPYFRQFARYRVQAGDWREYNRVHFWVYPDCEGTHAINIDLIYANDGVEKVPDAYNREGRHEVNLVNRQWNECFLEIPELPRDKITFIGFERAAFGKERSMGDTWRFDIGEIILETVDNPELVRGWIPSSGRIAYSMSGYEPDDRKTALMKDGGEKNPSYAVKDGAGRLVYEGTAVSCQTGLGKFLELDFSKVRKPGWYTLECAGAQTMPFRIDGSVWADSIWKVLNFVFCERCGTPVAGMHGSCHGDIIAEHGGLKLAYCGGWHDAGDMSQQTLQTADVTFALLEMARKAKCEDRQLYLRLLEEAEWGIDFLLKCRFPDGAYASSAGIVNWSDGYIGSFDDQTARVHCNSFDSFLYAACFATAAMTLEDEPLCEKLARTAKEDFDRAMAVYREHGFREKPIFWEHSLNTSESQYMATVSWSASCLYRLTRKEQYAAQAVEAIEYTLACQRKEPIGKEGLAGFFYRDINQRVIQHYNHQSRDAVYMQALESLIATQPNHPQRQKWMDAIALFGEYLKKASAFCAPWGMLPSGVYHIDEADDTESMQRQHPHANQSAMEEYADQLKAGVQLDEEHYLRRFPVWFSFRGNAAVLLATGKAAAICARVLGDEALRSIAREQLYWMVGKNPFCQSLMYGEGHNYPEQAVFLPGTMAGQLPVGIQTRGAEDVPYWPQSNNATYKEAWLTVAGKWLLLTAELL